MRKAQGNIYLSYSIKEIFVVTGRNLEQSQTHVEKLSALTMLNLQKERFLGNFLKFY